MSRILLVLLACTAGQAQNQPMFRGGLDHTGVYRGTAPRHYPKVKWQFATNGQVISSPAVAHGLVYIGSTDHHLYAIDRETGKEQWKFPTESSISSSPAVSAGVVYFASYDGNFYALDAETGKLKWKFETGGERRYAHKSLHGLHPAGETSPDPWDFYLSSPAVFNGAVYFGSGDNYVYSLDAATGSLKWKFRTGDVVHASPAIADDTVYIGSWDSMLYALETASGKMKWHFQAGVDPQTGNQQGFQSSPAVSAGVVYVGCRDSNLYAIDSKTGTRKWSVSNNGSWIMPSPAVYEGRVYFGTSDTGLLRIVDAETGSDVATIDAKFPVYSSPAIADGTVYVGTFGGKLIALDVKTRELLWEFQTEASTRNLAAFSKPDGKIDFSKMMNRNFYDDMVLGVAKYLTTGSILSTPVIDDGVIYFGSADGNVYALM
ncbi:MAG TPA: PQQ-binding-like beta-propeller repeat protein [Bryobacteraceae bacterium]|nr:PQQ-binding-like beta-propeller repeat protein [Bryobacteraceae bacterium]